MADLERTVAILFRGVDEISGTMNTISGSLSSFGGNLKNATQPLADIALGAEKATAALAVMAAGGMVVAVTAAGVFQSGLNEIHTLLRESPETVAAFDKAIESYAINSTQSLEDIQKAIYQSLSANVSYSESIKFVSDAEKLAVAGKSTLTQAVDLLTDVLTSYGEKWDQAGKYSDVFFKTVEIGKVTIPDLAGALAMVAPMATIAGISIEEVSSAIAAMTAGGMKAAPAAEYLRGMISDLIKPSQGSVDAFTNLGIAFGATELHTTQLSGKLKEIWEKTAGSGDAMIKLFGNTTSFTAAVILASDKSGYFAKALIETANAAGSNERAYGIMVDNFELLNTRLVNSMKLALIESGKPLLEDWANIANGLGKVFQGVKVGLSDGAFDEIYAEIDKFATEFGDYLREVAKAVPEAMKDVDFTAFLASIESLGTAVGDLFKVLFGDFDLTKPDELAAAIQKVVNAATKLIEFTTGIAEQLKPFATEMGNWINKAIDADTETTKLAGKVAGFGQAINTMVTALGFVGPAMAIFSGALVIDAVATLGKLGAALIALPGGPAILAAAGIATLAVGVGVLKEKMDESEATIQAHDKMIYDLSDAGIAATASLNSLKASTIALPQVQDLMFTTNIEPLIEQISTLNQCIVTFPDGFTVDFKDNFAEAQAKLNQLRFDFDAFPPTVVTEFLAEKQAIDDVALKIEGIPALKALTVNAELQNADYISNFMSEVGKDKNANIVIDITQASRQKYTSDMLAITNPDGTTTWINVGVDAASLAKTKNALEEIPTEKMLEIKLQGNIDKELAMIKTSADTVQKAMEWTAKVDIAKIEADTKSLQVVFGSMDNTISATSAAISSLFQNRPKSMFDFGAADWEKSIKQQLKLELEAFEITKKLAEAQIKILDTKNSLMRAGQGLIKVDSNGLEPQLEMIMWQILQKVQLRANEDAANFLLGI